MLRLRTIAKIIVFVFQQVVWIDVWTIFINQKTVFVTGHRGIRRKGTRTVLQKVHQAVTLGSDGLGKLQKQRHVGNGIVDQNVNHWKITGIKRIIVQKGQPFTKVNAMIVINLILEIAHTIGNQIEGSHNQFGSRITQGELYVVLVHHRIEKETADIILGHLLHHIIGKHGRKERSVVLGNF